VLAQEAAVVYLVHEGAQPQASAESIGHLASQPKIERIANAAIEEILGNDSGVTAVRVRGAAGTREIECAGVFPFIGLEPNGEIAPAEVPRDDHGALQVGAELETNLANLFAIGSVRAGFGGWLHDAVSDARRAARAVKARLG
jgi:thioredoxin reductase (NADPH)